MAFEWDCDCGWEVELDKWAPPPPPPFFNVPPPPVPPSLMAAAAANSANSVTVEDVCSDDHVQLGDTCQAFLVGDAEYQVPDSAPMPLAIIVVSAAILTTIIIASAIILWRYRKQKKQQKVQRCHKNAASPFDVPVALRGGPDESGALVDDAVLYDELLSYAPTHFRSNHSIPPAYEMRDVLKSPCQCTTHPLLSNSQHYVATPYHCTSTMPRHHEQQQTAYQQRSADQPNDWVTEPVYEELPSGPEDDRSSQSIYCSPDRRINYSINGRPHFQRGGSGSSSSGTRRSHWSGDDGCDVRETDFFLPPSTWSSSTYQNGGVANRNGGVRGQLTINGPVRRGAGGVRAAWREMPSHNRSTGTNSQSNNNRKKRKIKSKQADDSDESTSFLGTNVREQTTTLNSLYRGKCPPEPPPFSSLDTADAEEDHSGSGSALVVDSESTSQENNSNNGNNVRTLPRYYYYSENDDYGVTKQQTSPPAVNGSVQRSAFSDRDRRSQRHLHRNTRTRQSPMATQGV